MIKVHNLAKFFGPKRAVDGISFAVERGEVLGFLGPNGAGKSTTMRMITGFIPPNEGTVTVGGFDIVQQSIEAKRLIGYLPENAPAYTDMTVQGFLNFAAEIRGLRGEAKIKAVNRVVEMCFLESVRHQSIETLSKGYRHRTCFAQSIIHDPDVLVLDEPTDGLDPNQKPEWAGAVAVRGTGVNAATWNAKLGQLPTVKRAAILKEEATRVTARVFPKSPNTNGALARSIAEAAQGWHIEELHTEEGRLDEVFRSITMPDTAPAKVESQTN